MEDELRGARGGPQPAGPGSSRVDELEALLDAVPAIVFISHDPQGRKVTSNRAARELLHVGPAANLALNVPPEERATGFRFLRDGRELAPGELPMERAAATGEPQRDVEMTLDLGAEGRRHILGNAYPLMGDDGAVLGAVGAFIDVTDRRRAEEVLRFTQTVVDQMSASAYWANAEGRFVFVNKAACAALGYSRGELLDLHVWDIEPGDTEAAWKVHWSLLKEQGSLTFETRHRGRSGVPFPVEVDATLVEFSGREYACGIARDISERKGSEERLAEQASLLQLTHDSIIVRDLEDRVTFWNRGAADQYGWTEEEALGAVTHELLSTEFPVPLQEIKAALAATGRWEGELVHSRKDGSLLTVASRWAPQLDGAGRMVGILEINNDITERRRVETVVRELNAALERRVGERTAELETTTRELEGFSYSVSHDLRAPLRAIDGYAALLRQRLGATMDDESGRLLQSIADNGRLMGSLVDGLLDFTRIRSRELVRVPLDIRQLAIQVLTDLLSAPGRERVRVAVAELPPVHADRELAATALRHLLSNAIKFSSGRPEPLVEVGFRSAPDGAVYFVRDNGIGFDPKYAERLFYVFQRLDGPPEAGGTGIGLALVKRIVEKHGGRLWAEGAVNGGATFFFTLGPS